jgi:hypothetical protein
MKPAVLQVVSLLALAVVLLGRPLLAQEAKPVPKDSVRVYVAGCTKGMVFTAGPRMEDPPTSLEIREGMHLRMNGPKNVMTEIKAHEGSLVGITGLMKKGQYAPGVAIGGGVRISPGSSGTGGLVGNPGGDQIYIDVESWHPVAGSCPSR